MLSLLISVAIVVVVVTGFYMISGFLRAPFGQILQIIVAVIAAVYLLTLLGQLLGVVPELRLR